MTGQEIETEADMESLCFNVLFLITEMKISSVLWFSSIKLPLLMKKMHHIMLYIFPSFLIFYSFFPLVGRKLLQPTH